MYRVEMDSIFIDYAMSFNASMMSLWAVGQSYFLDWVEKQTGDMALEAKSDKPSGIKIQPLVQHIRANCLQDNLKGAFFTDLIKDYCTMFCIAAYARLEDDPRYHRVIQRPVVQFFRHIRNGCAHGNTFNFTTRKCKRSGKIIEEPSKPALFRGLEVKRSLMEEEKTVFFDFLAAGDIPYLIEDVSKELAKLE